MAYYFIPYLKYNYKLLYLLFIALNTKSLLICMLVIVTRKREGQNLAPFFCKKMHMGKTTDPFKNENSYNV